MSARGSYGAALRAFRKLTQLEPDVAAHWMNLGTALRSSGSDQEALQAYQQAERRGQDDADFHYNVALLQQQLGDLQGMRNSLELAAIRAPIDAEIRCAHVQACFTQVDTEATALAVASWRQWQNWTPELLITTAGLLLQMGMQSDAEQIVAQLERLPARSTDMELRMIAMLERVNRVDEAATRLAKLGTVTSAAEATYRRWLAMSAQLASRRDDNLLAASLYEQLLTLPSEPADRQHHLFSFAKVLDALGSYDRAISVIAEAHQTQVEVLEKLMPLDEDREVMAITQYRCDVEDAAGWQEAAPPSADDSPIFIVAFPRSGTTLLEQMLDAHPGVFTIDEQPFLQKATLQFAELGFEYPSALADMRPDQLAAIRRHYWEMVATKVQLKPGQRLLDKNPLNMLRLPAIRRLFPNAKILLAIRHPCDVIVSNYFQHYRAPEFVMLCRELPNLALGYRKCFDFWYSQQAILKADVLEVRYESFVTDFDRQSRSIAEFLHLAWHDDMLSPAKHARAKGFISTPSYSQVIQPVNTKAVGRWRRYEQVLGEVVQQTQPYLRKWDYL